MSKYVVKGSTILTGDVTISGSKNSALPIMAATILANGTSVISNVPQLSDIQNMTELLCCIGAHIDVDNCGLTIKFDKLLSDAVSYESVSRLRASFLVTAPLLARTGSVKISLPGGCRIGARPVDLHLKGLAAMGAQITYGHGFIEANCPRLIGNMIYLDFPSVGATETLIMAGALAHGETVIENAAAEPEVADLARFISAMGGIVYGAGTDTVKVVGVTELKGACHTVIPDRIEAGTFATAIAVTKGRARINHIIPAHLKPIIAKMRESGIGITEFSDCIDIDATGTVRAVDIKTLPYPGFPTDLQAPYTSMMSVADGTSVIVETIFENRFMHIPELARMGANVRIEGKTAVVEGINSLAGAHVKATDLRAGAALVMAGLCAHGVTEIDDIEHIQRGYFDFENKLMRLGADIVKIW